MLDLAVLPFQPWDILPYIGSSSPPCGFCGLFVRALNAAAGMRIRIAPIKHRLRSPPWSFPSFSSVPPVMENLNETHVMQLMSQDLQRVIHKEWRFVCFPFIVPWLHDLSRSESYSDSDDEDFNASEEKSSDETDPVSSSPGDMN